MAATDDVEAIIALRPDVIVHSAMADDRLFEALGDLQRMLRAGINVVSSGRSSSSTPRAWSTTP